MTLVSSSRLGLMTEIIVTRPGSKERLIVIPGYLMIFEGPYICQGLGAKDCSKDKILWIVQFCNLELALLNQKAYH